MGNTFTTTSASAGSSPATGRYADQGDIENIFGIENVKRWSNLDNDSTTADTDRIEVALTMAEAKIHTALRGGIYTLPLVLSDESVEFIRELQARLAGVWLYESRGIDDVDEATGQPVHRLAWHARHARDTLRRIQAGAIRLQAGLNDSRHPDIPVQP